MISSYIRYVLRSSSMIKCSRYLSNTSQTAETASQLIKTYNNHGEYGRAFQLFDQLVKKNDLNIVSLLNIIDTCARSREIERGKIIENLINQSEQWKTHLRLQTSLIHMHMKCHQIVLAEQIFQKIRLLPDCDIVVYNAMLKGYLFNHKPEHCFKCIEQLSVNISPDNVTYILLLNACAELCDEKRGRKIHKELIEKLDGQHVNLQNALIDFYGKINDIKMAEHIFNNMSLRETSTYNSLMKVYLINNMPLNVLDLFERMKRVDMTDVGPICFQPDLITFMAICDACESLGLLTSPDSSYKEYNWRKIFSKPI